MSILTILGMVMPLITKIIGVFFDRIWRNGYSTVAGTAAGAGVFAILEQSGCNMANFDKTLLAIIAALPGLLSSDAGKTVQTIPQAVTEVIQENTVNPLNP